MGNEKGKRQTTPTMTEILKLSIEQRLCDLYTSMPGSIVSYEKDTGLATVRPLLRRKYKSDSDPIDLPLISNVPVCFPSMGKSRLRFPVTAGDEGEIRWQMRSIDLWLKTGGVVDPLDPRKFNISDATFCLGLRSQANISKLNGDETSTVLDNDKGFIEITPDGKFKITNGTVELFALIVETMGEMITEMTEQGENDFTNTIFGPLQPINFAKYTELKGKYEALKGKFDTLKKG